MESEIPTEPNTQPTDKEGDDPIPAAAEIAEMDILPKQLQIVYKSITSTLSNMFTEYPPHTIQRFAELILNPNEHYRTLPAYLHALDRVVHVTSGAHIFPLPSAVPSPSSAKVLSNGVTGVDPSTVSWGNAHDKPAPSMLGSDESLGGALLTPISWLTRASPRTGTDSPMEGEVRTESTTMTDGPNGPGGVETVTVSVNGISSTTPPADTEDDTAATLRAEGGITQGELLRQEQRAGVVPAGQIHRGGSDGMGEEHEPPHARGPEEIGMEDMGPQSGSTERKGFGPNMQGIDIEAAVGRKIDADEAEEDVKMKNGDASESEKAKQEAEGELKKEEGEATEPATPKREADDELVSEEKRTKVENEKKDVDVEMELVDADGKRTDESKIGEKGETRGADAVDASSL